MHCMNLEKEPLLNENIGLLLEIPELKRQLRELYRQSGPGSSDYISISIKLDLLIQEYFEEKARVLQY
ncbi:hypothetical protein [Bacillus marasmi]|uniref:hypothetical protein n=1 Tax=Bacillus marasmi TaxID=1926279 RepID=UPI0011C86183|nr:hypothetical protein [Bacillus marasmi]